MSGSQWAIRKGAPLLLLLFALPPMLGQMLFPSPFTFMPCPLEEVTSILSLSPLWEGYKNFWPPLFPMFTPLCVNVVSPIGQSMEITRSCVICVWGQLHTKAMHMLRTLSPLPASRRVRKAFLLSSCFWKCGCQLLEFCSGIKGKCSNSASNPGHIFSCSFPKFSTGYPCLSILFLIWLSICHPVYISRW